MKIKTIITLILAILLCIPFIALGTSASEKSVDEYAPELIYAEFEDDKIAEATLDSNEDWIALNAYRANNSLATWETPELFMLDCKLTTYYRTTDAEKPTGAILYVVGYGTERIGTESDLTIVDDFLDEGYIVIVTEFLNSSAAVYPAIDGAVSLLRYEVDTKKQFVSTYYHDDLKYDTFVLPAGYRIKRDVTFFDITQSAADGTIEAIIAAWNDEDVKAEVEENGITYKTATSLDDITMPNGKAVNDVESGNKVKFLEYRLDIFYPSEPKDGYEAPVWTVGGSSYERTQAGPASHPERMLSIGALFRGYASVVYDHEYVPHMHGRDSYLHISGATFGMSAYTGAKFHSAAMRCIRAYAEELGYSKDNIGVMGHSKSSMVVVLSNPNPQLLSENAVYTGKKQGDTYGEQPYLTYKDGTPIPSNATCVYHSMGYGSITRANYLTPSNSPTFIACGVLDNDNPAQRPIFYWEQEFVDYNESGIDFGAVYMPPVGHTLPYYVADTIYDYVYYEAMSAFFDYYLLDAAPQIMYTGIELDGNVNTADKGLFIYFSGAITEWTLLKGVSVTDKNGNAVSGQWIGDCGGTRWTFNSDSLVNGETYTLKVNNTVAAENGKTLTSGYEKAFTVK